MGDSGINLPAYVVQSAALVAFVADRETCCSPFAVTANEEATVATRAKLLVDPETRQSAGDDETEMYSFVALPMIRSFL